VCSMDEREILRELLDDEDHASASTEEGSESAMDIENEEEDKEENDGDD
jgi:hypothetical protein